MTGFGADHGIPARMQRDNMISFGSRLQVIYNFIAHLPALDFRGVCVSLPLAVPPLSSGCSACGMMARTRVHEVKGAQKLLRLVLP